MPLIRVAPADLQAAYDASPELKALKAKEEEYRESEAERARRILKVVEVEREIYREMRGELVAIQKLMRNKQREIDALLASTAINRRPLSRIYSDMGLVKYHIERRERRKLLEELAPQLRAQIMAAKPAPPNAP